MLLIIKKKISFLFIEGDILLQIFTSRICLDLNSVYMKQNIFVSMYNENIALLYAIVRVYLAVAGRFRYVRANLKPVPLPRDVRSKIILGAFNSTPLTLLWPPNREASCH